MHMTFGICVNNILLQGIWYSAIPHLPGCFLLDLLSEYRIQYGAIGPLYVTSSNSTWIFCRGFQLIFATDCPCVVWCRELTTYHPHVGPPFGNRLLNNSWAIGFTWWTVYLFFFVYVLIHHIIFRLYLYFLNNVIFFKYTGTNIFHRRSLYTFYWKWTGHASLLLITGSAIPSPHHSIEVTASHPKIEFW